ncbi:MAG TPA: hypothetical protein VMF65_18235 [Acidimicrobiales bacterium]|nr:hypothetical protein [Acidimicrobiales bacterium]
MTFTRVAIQYPRLANKLSQLSPAGLETAVRGVVDKALTATNLQVPDQEPREVERLVWSLDDAVWALQEKAEQDPGSQLPYLQAFRRARAASALLDQLEGRYDTAVYEAMHALGANEEEVIELLDTAS